LRHICEYCEIYCRSAAAAGWILWAACDGACLNRMNYSMNTLALEVLQLSPDDHVLEIGFGGGELMTRMASAVTRGRIAGADFDRCCRYRYKTF